jgi:hypothetical protein
LPFSVFPKEQATESGFKMNGGTRIYVKLPTAKTIALNVDTTDTIKAVKVGVRAKEGIPVKEQRLIWQSILLEDDDTLAGYNIKAGSTLQLLMRVTGGGTFLNFFSNHYQRGCDRARFSRHH